MGGQDGSNKAVMEGQAGGVQTGIDGQVGSNQAGVKGQGGPDEKANAETIAIPIANAVDPGTVYKLSYGLFVLTAREGEKDNGCIINTAAQITSSPMRLSITVIKKNYTHDMIMRTGEFNVSILSESVPFSVFTRFGFQSGKDADKFEGFDDEVRTANGVQYIQKYTNAVISGKVINSYDYGTHTLFIADITQAMTLSDEPSVTYQYYFDNIKPKPQPKALRDGEGKKGFVCKICGYVYEGETLPDDYICPLCKHGAVDFEPL
ncbi:MAG: flavin reductase [Oscillospiraceae bacterium]|nr:flavin reductase [Oscillospiraceae bacterium]